MSMSKKDFEAIARLFANTAMAGNGEEGPRTLASEYRSAHYNARRTLAEDLADYCAQANPNFDRARFLQACGIREE